MAILLGIVILFLIFLIAVLFRYQRQMKDICRQLAFLKENESNMLISRAMDFGGIRELTDCLNDFLIRQRKAKKEYLGKEQVISDTYTNLSHDIRTPLTSLDGYVQLLEDSNSAEEQKRYMEVIRERISCLNEMLEELFTFTKLKNETYQIKLSPCCINRILKDTIFSYYEEWQKQGIKPELAIAEEPFWIEGNAAAIKRIIQNVIKNGLDHGKESIFIQLQREREDIVLRIGNKTDHPEQIDVSRVFTRFYKADTARSKNSTGLGLAIAKELSVRMDGQIYAEVKQDELLCFRMKFDKRF